MSPRAKSWVGGVLFGLGVLAFFAGALFPGVVYVAWIGIGVALIGLVLIGLAVRDVVRQIGSDHARFEAELRHQVPPKRDDRK